jgi:geranylgeranyl reductase family protein
MYDIAIVGAGPAGASAALKLAEAGVNCVLLEKKTLPRDKTCGGGVVHRARRLLTVDIASVVERECYSATMHLLSSHLSFEARRDNPLISMTTRASLDHLLVRAAQNAGTVIREGAAVRSVSVSNRHVDIQTTSGPVKAQFVIAADGLNSVVARSAGWKETRLLAPAIEAELYLPDKELSLHVNTARFDFDISPHGYAWLFPKKNHLSAGVLSVRHGKVALKNLLFRYLKAVGISEVQKTELRGSVIPLTPRQDGFARDRVILTGDSAGFADPLTAEGISFAIRSGHLAAWALLSADFNAHRTVTIYEKAIRRTIVPELTAARILAKVLYGSPKLRTWVFRRYGKKITHAVTDIILGERSYHNLITNPKNYLKLLSARNAHQ